jgi:hypothetical protein
MQEPETASPSGPEGAITLVSPAWLRHGPFGMFGSVEPGLLIAREGGRISFVTQKERVFEAQRPEIGVSWPWWEFGAGVHLKVAGKMYRLSLARPPSAPDIDVGERGGLASTLAGLDPTGISSLGRAFASGKAWRSYLDTERADDERSRPQRGGG